MTPATDWKEIIAPDEETRFLRYAEELAAMQRSRAHGRPMDRALHVKANLGLHAQFSVLPNLPDYAQVGLFATPQTYSAYVRFSNGAPGRQADRKPDVRGIAIKLLGVGGKKLIPGLEDCKTQDFLLIKSAVTPFRNVDEFIPFALLGAKPITGFPSVISRVGFGRTMQIIKRFLPSASEQVVSLATTRYYGPLPNQYGPYAARFALWPRASNVAGAKAGDSRDYLAEELSERLRKGPVAYDFRAQFFMDETRTPIEDGSVEWKEQDSPFVTIGRLTLAQQDVGDARGQRILSFIQALAFDPWHSQVEFRPLGNMMRARNQAYRLSTQARNAAAEPTSSDCIA